MSKEQIRIEKYKIVKLLYTGDYLGRGDLQQDYLLAPIVKQQLSKHPILSQYFYEQEQIQQSYTVYNTNSNQLDIKTLKQSKQIIFPHQLINSHTTHNRQNGYLVYQIPLRSVWICNISSIRLKSQLYCISLMYNAYEKVLKPLINVLNQHSLQFIQINNVWVKDNHFFMFLKPKRQESIINLQTLQQDYKSRRMLNRATYNREDLEKIALKKLANIIFKILYNNDYEKQKSKLSPFIFVSHLLIMMLGQSITFKQFQSLMNDKSQRKKFVHHERNKFITKINQKSPQSIEKRNHKFYLLSKGKQRTLKNDYYTPQSKKQSYKQQSFLPPSFVSNKKHSNIFNRIKQKKQRIAYTQPIEIDKSNDLQTVRKPFTYTKPGKNYHHSKLLGYNCKNRYNSLSLSDQYCKIQQQSEKKVLKRYRETLQASDRKDKLIEKSPSQQKKAMEDLKNRIKRSLHFDRKTMTENENLIAGSSQPIKKKRQNLNDVQLQKIVKKSLKIQYEVDSSVDNLQQSSQTLPISRSKSRLAKNNGSLSHQDTYHDSKIENSFIHIKLQKQQKIQKQEQKGKANTHKLAENLIENNIEQKTNMAPMQKQHMMRQQNYNNHQLNKATTQIQKVYQQKDKNQATKSNASIKIESVQKQQHYKNEENATKKQTMPKTASKPEIKNQEFNVIKNLFDHEIAIDYVDIPQVKILNRQPKQQKSQVTIALENSSPTLKKKKTSILNKLISIQPDININEQIEEIRLVKKNQSNLQLQLPPQHVQQLKKQSTCQMVHKEQPKQQQITIKNQTINKQVSSTINTNDSNKIGAQKNNAINTGIPPFLQKKEKIIKNKIQNNQLDSVYGPSASVENQVEEYIHLVNKIGQAVAKTSKITKKLQGIQWYIGLYFVYKRFYFQRKNIYQKLNKGIPKLTRYQNSINEQQWQQWLKSEHRQNILKKIAADNVNIKASIQKMNNNITKKPNVNQILEFITLEKRFSHQSFLCVQYVVDQFDQLYAQKFNKKQLDEQICTHMSQMLSSLLIIAQLDGKIKPTKCLQSFKKVMKVNEMKIFADKIYKLYGLDEQ